MARMLTMVIYLIFAEIRGVLERSGVLIVVIFAISTLKESVFGEGVLFTEGVQVDFRILQF